MDGSRAYHCPIKFIIRQSKLADGGAIAKYNIALAWETENLRLDPAIITPGVEAVLRDPAKGAYYVAESGGAVVGQVMITYEWSDWRNGNFWWLQSVYVHQDFRAHGIFKALYAYIVTQAATQKDVIGLRLYMESENHRARQVYQRLGMVQTHYQVFERIFPKAE